MRRPAPKPPSAQRPLQRKEGAASEQQPMPAVRVGGCSGRVDRAVVVMNGVTPAHRARSGWAAAAPAPRVSVGPLILVQRLEDRRSPLALVTTHLRGGGKRVVLPSDTRRWRGRSATLLLDAKFVPGQSVHDAVLCPCAPRETKGSVPWAGT
jgi:hypothetical protein